MMIRRRSTSLVSKLLSGAAWLIAPAIAVAQGQPSTPATQPTPTQAAPVAPSSPAQPANTAQPSNPAQPQPAAAPPTDPNPQVGPNAVAQANQPNLAVRAPGNQRNFSLARVPNMIGDLTGGGGAQIQTTGLFSQNLSHPSLTNGRLNIAENNSPVIGDRAYFTYRHFEAASSLDYQNGVPGGGSASQNIDRFMFGLEHTLSDTNSLELRLPFNGQLDSNLLVSQLGAQGTNAPYGTTNFELGNVNLIFKQALIDAADFYLSGGLGLNIPTAPDVKVRTRIFDPAFQVSPLITTPLNLDQQIAVRNQTVNLSPYLSAAYRPGERSFVQGFLQFDVPLNGSSVSLDEFYTVGGGTVVPTQRQSFRGTLDQQVLMRANVGAGRWWRYRDGSRYFHSIATMFEVHYTTALDDAQTVGPFRLNSNVPQFFTQTQVGNVANRVDVVNLTAGVPMIVGLTTFTHAFTLPIRGELNRSFDLEYSLLIDRRF